MACVVNLFDALDGSPSTGGNWFYGANPSIDLVYGDGTCPVTGSTFMGIVEDDQIGTGEDICVDLTGVAAGSYLFVYITPGTDGPEDCGIGCTGCATVTITTRTGPVDGDPVEYCDEDPTEYILYDLLGNTPSTVGNWTCDDPLWTTSNGKSTNDIGDDDFVKPSTLPPGVYTFTYTVESFGECDNCVATVEVTIVAAPGAGADSDATICV